MKDEKGLELKVGFFVAVGLAFIAVMVFKFGSVGQGFSKTYPITVDFPSADGLIKRSDVKLNGARIGYVAEKPRNARNVGGVAVPLALQEEVKIPKGSHFVIGSSGLLGDRFVDVVTDAGFRADQFNPDDDAQTISAGTIVKGEKAGGFEALTKKGEQVLDQLNGEIGELKEVTARIKDGILSEKSVADIQGTFSNLRLTSDHLSVVSKDLGGVLAGAQITLNNANDTITTLNGAAGKIDPAIADLRKVFTQAQEFIKSARSGDGALGALLYDRKTSENLRSLISNLRAHGVLFYRDSAAKRAAEAAPAR